jgi:hypothetical protein
MRLYKNSNGVWAGTQADARKYCGKDYSTVDVPTDKPSLLGFLNLNQVGRASGSPTLDAIREYDIQIGAKDIEPVYAPDTDLDKKALSYFEWGYDKLRSGEFADGTEMIRKALLYQKTHNMHEEES